MRFAVLLLLCLGCSSAPTTYNQAAFRPPPPPRFSPVEDAPHVFAPDRPSPVQPGPRPTRVLPQTPETRRGPGIWAGDGEPLKPLRDQPAPPLIVLGEELPHAPEVKTAWDAQPALHCAMAIDTGATLARVRGRVAALPMAERSCLAAIMQFACMKWMEEWQEEAIKQRASDGEPARVLSQALLVRMRASKEKAFQVAQECGYIDGLSDEGKRLLVLMRDARPDPFSVGGGGGTLQ